MAKQHAPAFVAIVEEAKSRIKETDITHVKTQLEQEASFHLIDVREASEWQAGHLPQAIHLSKGILERDIEKTISDKNSTLMLYCGGGYRSALAADNLQKMGYKNVLSMDGGFRAWKEAGYLIENS